MFTNVPSNPYSPNIHTLDDEQFVTHTKNLPVNIFIVIFIVSRDNQIQKYLYQIMISHMDNFQVWIHPPPYYIQDLFILQAQGGKDSRLDLKQSFSSISWSLSTPSPSSKYMLLL